uniref:Uncharacterized protein n=1 Tax=Tetraselmis sp. GSL018 TaxID=582737 RepID=A0A061SHI9_9CHLO|eukprot:CAMPEP_0177615236 /NCGR_PEP_ID=MMETSP0419_2-20121207/23293_1 /TAXON_ID=582737 /ORGANISM="Tetraselmis sp., Strain GSL018" /LENGTH=395 /DNA_ID=CAMNT_0019112771 /DNA_START=584 /DNA_END=1771 /DNA_ORIENTATION=+
MGLKAAADEESSHKDTASACRRKKSTSLTQIFHSLSFSSLRKKGEKGKKPSARPHDTSSGLGTGWPCHQERAKHREHDFGAVNSSQALELSPGEFNRLWADSESSVSSSNPTCSSYADRSCSDNFSARNASTCEQRGVSGAQRSPACSSSSDVGSEARASGEMEPVARSSRRLGSDYSAGGRVSGRSSAGRSAWYGVPNCEARAGREGAVGNKESCSSSGSAALSQHSWLSRTEADLPVDAVLCSSLYSEQAVVPTVPASERSGHGANTDEPAGPKKASAPDKPDRDCRSAEHFREARAPEHGRSSCDSRGRRPPQGYVDQLSLEEEAEAIVSPATRMAIARDGIKYRNTAKFGCVDAHAGTRARATQAQLARLAFNLPSVRDAENQRLRNELKM